MWSYEKALSRSLLPKYPRTSKMQKWTFQFNCPNIFHPTLFEIFCFLYFLIFCIFCIFSHFSVSNFLFFLFFDDIQSKIIGCKTQCQLSRLLEKTTWCPTRNIDATLCCTLGFVYDDMRCMLTLWTRMEWSNCDVHEQIDT